MDAALEDKPSRRKTEDERILGVQLELFPSATEEDLTKALRLLKQYVELKLQVDDYKAHEDEIRQTIYEGEIARKLEADELYANKPANAIILAINQKRAAEECEVIRGAIERAVSLIRDEDARKATHFRYIKGYSYSETLMFFNRGIKSTTMDRKLKLGLASVANTLKLWGIIK